MTSNGKVLQYLQITTTAAEELFDLLLHVCCILSNMAVASSIFNCKKKIMGDTLNYLGNNY